MGYKSDNVNGLNYEPKLEVFFNTVAKHSVNCWSFYENKDLEIGKENVDMSNDKQ